jgi:hypothetical protein
MADGGWQMVGDVVGDVGERNFRLLFTDYCCGNKLLSKQGYVRTDTLLNFHS